MSDFPENLQVIKLEPTSPTTSEDKSPHNIKAKLNLHVKRRLQDYGGNHSQDDNEQPQGSYSQQQQQHSGNVMLTPDHNKGIKEQQRQKRPYHKRADKAKSNQSVAPQQSPTEGTPTTPQRKYKSKFKPVATTGNPDSLTPISQDDTSSHATTLNAGAVSAGDEDEAGHDDMRQAREKEKCPDVLAMVLSMKKRALMQDPEVQEFLAEVMKVIKS